MNTTTTTPMMAKAVELGGREWTARNGSVRIYINGWAERVGLEVSRYKTGNISSANYNGEHVSNKAAGELLSLRAYVDSTGLHVETTSGTGRYILPQMVAALTALLEA